MSSPCKDFILSKARDAVHGGRGYAHPLDDFTRTAKIWSAILDTDVTPEQVGLCMVGLKISRECDAHKEDNLVDMAGYPETIAMVHQRKAEQEGTKMMSDEGLAEYLKRKQDANT